MKSLTIKQRQVRDLLAKGMTSKEIASGVGIGPRTVEGHGRLAKDGRSQRG
jgi:DNA-binding CsgD family transcriptional regulator